MGTCAQRTIPEGCLCLSSAPSTDHNKLNMGDWGYALANGPKTWHKNYPIATGKQQSPVDICPSTCQKDDALKPIKVDYSGVEIGEVENTGASWKAQVTGGKSSLTGGPLSSTFVLEQFHAHWGSHDKVGSEHTVDGIMHPAELHLVHWDSGKFKSFAEAASAPKGLAVLGMFLKIGPKPHAELEKLVKLMSFMTYKGQKINISDSINCANFLPGNLEYFTYDGSLTTPPLFESVNWIVFKDPIEVSAQQMAAFRSLKSYCKGGACPCDELRGKMVDNYRPPVPLHDRKVKVFSL